MKHFLITLILSPLMAGALAQNTPATTSPVEERNIQILSLTPSPPGAPASAPTGTPGNAIAQPAVPDNTNQTNKPTTSSTESLIEEIDLDSETKNTDPCPQNTGAGALGIWPKAIKKGSRCEFKIAIEQTHAQLMEQVHSALCQDPLKEISRRIEYAQKDYQTRLTAREQMIESILQQQRVTNPQLRNAASDAQAEASVRANFLPLPVLEAAKWKQIQQKNCATAPSTFQNDPVFQPVYSAWDVVRSKLQNNVCERVVIVEGRIHAAPFNMSTFYFAAGLGECSGQSSLATFPIVEQFFSPSANANYHEKLTTFLGYKTPLRSPRTPTSFLSK